MRKRLRSTPAHRQRLLGLWLLGALWSVAVVALTALLLHERVDAEIDRVDATAAVRVKALRETLALSLAHFTALPTHLARQPEVQALLRATSPPARPAADAGSAPESTPRLQPRGRPRVPVQQAAAMDRSLERLALDFNLSAAVLLDRDGDVVASGFANRLERERELPGRHLASRPYFQEAMVEGNARRYLHGRMSGTPGFVFASRILVDGEAIGVAVLRQDTQPLNRLITDPQRSRVLVTDTNGVVVLSSQPDPQLRRLPGPSLTDPQWIEQYGEIPAVLPWQTRFAGFSGRNITVLDLDGLTHVQRSTTIGDPTLRVWVLAPLEPTAALLQALLPGIAALWAAGCVLLWAGGRRLQWLENSNQARRDMVAMTRSLPLTVFRYEQPPGGQPGHFTYLGRGTERLFGATRAQIEADPALPWRLAGDAAGQPPTAPLEFALRRDDRLSWVLAHSTPLRESDGTTVYNGYWLDVTERRETERRLAALFAHAPTGFVFFDLHQGISRCNPAALALFGVDDEAALRGRSLFFPGLSAHTQAGAQPTPERALELLHEHRRTGERVVTLEWQFLRLDGTPFDTETSIVALEHEGEPQYCAVVQDVTLRKQAQAALQRARDVAESASRTKSSFLANMSHELRTPMNAIIGMTHLALEDGLPARQRDYIDKAHQSARSLLEIVDDILDVSKIEAGQLALERTDFELDGVIEAMSDVLSQRAEEKGLELLFSAAADLPQRLVGDPTRLRQVLVNLGGNAIKFTDHGDVTVGMELASQAGDEVELHGWVRDTGIGIDPQTLERLFQPFTQADSSTTRRFGGTGLGLAISRQLVELMGGRLWVDSAAGQGSTFHFTARFGRSTTRSPVRPWLASELGGRRALLVDDNPTALDVLAPMLVAMDIAVDRAASGAEALARLAHPPGSYSWVLVDWKMPGMDGVDCIKRLQDGGVAGESLPAVILVSAFGRDEALQAGKAAGLVLGGVLQKPITQSTLYQCLLRSRSAVELVAIPHPGEARRSARFDETVRERLQGKRVLLVEDHPLNQELACELLRRAGVQVEVAGDGREALERLDTDPGFDAVLMDCQMPVMDGYAATRALRADPRFQRLPIIAMTASAFADDRDRALASGMDAHITKPLDVEAMLGTLADGIEAGQATPVPTAVAQAAGLVAALPGSAADAIDTDDGLARCMGKVELYRRLLSGFRDSETRFEEAVGASLADGRWADAIRLAHDLKGLSGTIGAHRLHATARALQEQLAAHDAATAKTVLAQAVGELNEVLREIDGLLDAPLVVKERRR